MLFENAGFGKILTICELNVTEHASFTTLYILITQLSKASLYGVLNIFTVDFVHENLQPSSENQMSSNSSTIFHIRLPDLSTMEHELSVSNRTKIFFVQTSENEDLIVRHGCSIEAAALLHPNGLILVLMKAQYVSRIKGAYSKLNLQYKNVHFVHFNESQIYANTPLAKLNQTSRIHFIRYFVISHMSDFIRTALLYKYGGIYFDLDVIPLRKFDKFKNSVGLESQAGVNVAVLAFESGHLALDIQMDKQLASFSDNFQSLCWSCVGPTALSDALRHLCDGSELHIHQKEKCHDIDIHYTYAFYPIAYQNIPIFFHSSTSSLSIEYLIKNQSIYSIHYFHHMTMNLDIELNSPFAQIAQSFCPSIYEQLILKHNDQKHKSSFIMTNIYIILLCLLLSILCIMFSVFMTFFLPTQGRMIFNYNIIILAIQKYV
ncbi:unnamed protein product [Didymodactylos carnosus]|uniref:Alpha 1,4-glycosyltransferase domain-containing protein n=1 Tax=Didymodactylos carnosus TaxID=1234261 RepID=A0A813S2A5_9BILA|nr:unnamed protein product [Didymodactylos carnosus]CAF0788529.1 unnamed protein product [Didymodactylos carnosus]CAF3547558.1 unnamed protein product [Didymodactylos carnosus]CAF3572583.1 unnamed protein product [Didymodactylos carnosus]